MSTDRFKNIQMLYEERLKHMQQQIKQICYKIQNDDIANTMKESYVSQEFLADRIKEIIQETLVNEKEMLIEQNMQEIAYLKTEIASLQVQY